MKITIRKDIDELTPLIHELKHRQLRRAVHRSIDRTLTTTTKFAAQRYNDVYGLKAAEVKDRLFTRIYGDKDAVVSEISGLFQISNRPIPLILFRARQLKAGVKARLASDSKVIKSAFIATMPTGHMGVYKRDTRRPTRRRWVNDPSKPRGGYFTALPIRELWGVSVYSFFRARGNFGDVVKVAEDTFNKNLSHETDRAIELAKEKSANSK